MPIVDVKTRRDPTFIQDWSRVPTHLINSDRQMPNSAKSKRLSSGDLNPEIWGPAFWFVMYTTSGNYAAESGGDHATEDDKAKFKFFIDTVSEILPCTDSRSNIGARINTALCEIGVESLDGIVDRKTAVLFVYTLHAVVNEQLNKPLNFTVDDARSLIESFRLDDTSDALGAVARLNTTGSRTERPLPRAKLDIMSRRVKHRKISVVGNESRPRSNNPKNGLYPRAWGPVFWFVIYAVASSYAKGDGCKASDVDKIAFMDFLHCMMINLPCKGCRSNYKGAMKRAFSNLEQQGDSRILSFKDRRSVSKFIYALHSAVSEDVHARRAGVKWTGMDFSLADVFKNAKGMADSNRRLSLQVVPEFAGSSFSNKLAA